MTHNNIKVNIYDIGWEHGTDWSGSGYGQVAGCCEHGNEHLGSIEYEKFDSTPWSEWVSGWVSERVGERASGWVSEWVGEWVSEWMGELVSEWVNE